MNLCLGIGFHGLLPRRIDQALRQPSPGGQSAKDSLGNQHRHPHRTSTSLPKMAGGAKVPVPPPVPRAPGGQPQPHPNLHQQQQPTPQQLKEYNHQLQIHEQQVQQHQHQKLLQQHQQSLTQRFQNGMVKTRDLRDEMPPSKAKALEETSFYSVYRFEEARDEDEYLSDGHRPESERWVRVRCSHVPGMSKEETSREIRRLDRETLSVADKKATLSSAQLQHIELTLEEQRRNLERQWDPQIYETNLVQLDHNLLTIPNKKKSHEVHSHHGHHHHHHHHHSQHHRRGSETPIPLLTYLAGSNEIVKKSGKKSKHERHDTAHGKHKVTKPSKMRGPMVDPDYITAYFKTSPRSHIDPVKLYIDIKAAQEANRETRERRALQPPGPPPQQPLPPQQDTGFVNLNQLPPRGRSQDNKHGSRSRSRKPSRGSPRRRRSPDSSSRSSQSSTFTSHNDEMSSTSSVSDRSPHRGRTRHPRKPVVRVGGFQDNERRFFGQGAQQRYHRINDSNHIPPLPVGVEDIAQIQNMAYEKGRTDERLDRRDLVQDTVALAAAVLPKLGHRQPSPPLLRPTHEPQREVDTRMGLMHFQDDWDIEDDFGDPPRLMYRVVSGMPRGYIGGLRGRGSRGDVEDLNMDRRRRDHNDYLMRRSGQGLMREGMGRSYARERSYERISPTGSEDGIASPGFARRYPFH